MIQTKRLILREPRLSDLDAMFAIYSDRETMRYWSTPPHTQIAQTKERLQRHIDGWKTVQTYFYIEVDGVCIGSAGNHWQNEIGFLLSRDHWGKGYVTEAMQTLIPYIFNAKDHAKLTADVDPNNAASIALMAKLGFTETHRAKKTFCLNGVWADSIYYALKRP